MTRVMIFGLGSIGRRHAKILLKDFNCEVIAYRSGRGTGMNDLGIREAHGWSEVERLRPDVAFITNPTALHIKTAVKCASLGAHLFIEKPLSHNLKDVRLLESICRKNKLTCYTAYCLRFHPVIMKIRELSAGKDIYHVRVACSSYLPEWRPDWDFRRSYSSSSTKGGGVLLDLSHEFDYIQYIFGDIKKIEGIYGRVSRLTLDSEDFTDVLITLDNGICVNLHINFFSRLNERVIKIDFDGGYLIGDLLKGEVVYFFRGRTRVFKFDIDRDKYLKEQIRYFFDRIGDGTVMNDLRESGGLLNKILKFKNG